MANPMLNALSGVPIESSQSPGYGLRVDGTQKGEGFLGKIPTKDGRVMTEQSIGVEIDGEEMLIPAIVPTLTEEEISFIADGGDIKTRGSIMDKAVRHAMGRLKRGESVFHNDEIIAEPSVDEFLDRLLLED